MAQESKGSPTASCEGPVPDLRCLQEAGVAWEARFLAPRVEQRVLAPVGRAGPHVHLACFSSPKGSGSPCGAVKRRLPFRLPPCQQSLCEASAVLLHKTTESDFYT